MFWNIFQNENLKIKNFPHYKIFSWDFVIFAKATKIVKKWQSQKIFVENFFWSESIQNVFKRILKRKSQNRKFFLITKFFRGT